MLLVLCGLVVAGSSGAQSAVDLSEQEALVELYLPNRAALDELAESGQYDLAEYVNPLDDGSFLTQVWVTDAERAEMEADGFQLGRTIQDYNTYVQRIVERNAAIEAEARSHEAAENGGDPLAVAQAAGLRSIAYASALAVPELSVNRVDYFQNYAGWFLSVEAFDDLVPATGSPAGTGPTVSVAWKTATGDYSNAITMPRYIDSDPSPDSYLYNRVLIRIGNASPPYGSSSPPAAPTMVRVGSSTGVSVEAPVRPWLASTLPPHASDYQMGFHNRYMDPTEITNRFEELATEFPNISQLISLPNKTNGYRRLSAAVMWRTGGTAAGAVGAIGSSPNNTAAQNAAVVLTATRYGGVGDTGGNATRAEFRNPGVPDSPLSISVVPNTLGQKDVIVSLATDAAGALTSTAAQVVAAINADPSASAELTATPWATNTGAGIVQARPLVNLSDFLTVSMGGSGTGITNDNSHVARAPFVSKVLRIGKQRDGSRTGVFIFCQQHAREWVTPITCLETAEELLRNYATDEGTRELVDNLDIFILPSDNPDGAHYSLYNFGSQRKNMTNYCAPTSTNAMPSGRNTWGVDLNRNSGEYSLFDGYFGATTSCTGETYSGPSEYSEPETRNLTWVVDTFPNIKFSNNIHTSGGYFMWAPGSYTGSGRITAPAPNIGIEAYFFAAADTVLQRIKDVRGTVVLPQRTGPIADVLYSAAGNAADDQWYRNGIIAYSFEAGSDRFTSNSTTTLSVGSAAGATGVRVASTSNLVVGATVTIGSGADEETRTIASLPSGTSSPNPNVLLTGDPLTLAHAAGSLVLVPGLGGLGQSGVGFFPNYATEGRFEAIEFAQGNFGLFESALAYQRDHTPPLVKTSPESAASQTPIEWTFEWVNEPSVVHYTTDGSMPTLSSPEWERTGLRRHGEVFTAEQTTTVRWLAVDIAGNSSVGETTFYVETTAPTTTASFSPAAQNGYYRNPFVSLLADDDVAGGGSGIEKTEYNLDGAGWQTYSGPFQVTGDGSHTLLFRSIDKAGNQEADQTVTFEVDGTGPAITITTPPNGAVYTVGQNVKASYSCTTTGAALASCTGSVANGSSITTASIGTKTFNVSASDAAGNTTSASTQYKVVWPFKGFAFTWLAGSPFDAKPGAYGEAKAGDDIPVFFTLGGNYGLSVLAAGSPSSAALNCNQLTKPWYLASKKAQLAKAAKAKAKKKKRKLSHGSTPKEFGSLSYVKLLGIYTFEWNTNKDWKNTCRMLSLTLADGTTHTALFKFKK